MTEKRYRTEQIEGATLPFIVDNYSAKKHKTMTGYKAYDTTTVKKCDELTDLLNNYEDENEQLKSENEGMILLINNLSSQRNEFHHASRENANRNGKLEEENKQLKKQIVYLEQTKDFCEECSERLEKENDQLKCEIRNVQKKYEQLWMRTYE